jgi:hemolysin III
MEEHTTISPKPAWRGRLHQVAFFVSVPAGVSLVVAAGTALARIGALIYAISLSGMYAASAAFHRIDWGPRAWRWMRRLDHSMIYLLIAGTYTPFSLLVLDGAWTIVVLSVVWSGALFGIAWKLSTSRLPGLGAGLYIVLGWVVIVALPAIVGRLSVVEITLLFAGGILYTAGSVILLRRRPDPNPTVFGYHEVWHSMVIAASACHYALILMIVV